MNRKQKRLIQALKDLGLTKHATKEDIVNRSNELTKDNFEYGYCENYTLLKEIYGKSQLLLNNFDKLKDLEDFDVIKML